MTASANFEKYKIDIGQNTKPSIKPFHPYQPNKIITTTPKRSKIPQLSSPTKYATPSKPLPTLGKVNMVQRFFPGKPVTLPIISYQGKMKIS
jgi:hypothetical protein